MRSVYIAGASAEVDIAEHYIAEVKKRGYEITHDWTIHVRKHWGRPESLLPPWEKMKIADLDIDGVLAADIFWLLTPKNTSRGAYFELGCAVTLNQLTPLVRRKILVSGENEYSSFVFAYASGVIRFGTHDDALNFFTPIGDE